MTNPTELAMTLARSALEEQAARIAELEEALRELLDYADKMHRLHEREDGREVDYITFPKARSVLNKETNRG